MLFTKNYFKIGAFLLLIVLLLSGCSGRRAGEAKSPGQAKCCQRRAG